METWPFPVELTKDQDSRLRIYAQELRKLNRQFNLVSRQDEDHILVRHVGHCLALAHAGFLKGCRVADWGTGGGLPAIPLAILFPSVTFVGVDSNQKKTRSVDLFARRLGLDNVLTIHARAETLGRQIKSGALPPFDLSVSRATAPLQDLWSWHIASARDTDTAFDIGSPDTSTAGGPSSGRVWESGLVCLKGGDLEAEIEALRQVDARLDVDRIPLRTLTQDPYFATKEIVHVRVPRA